MRFPRSAASLELDGIPAYERDMNAEQLAVIRHEAGPIACYAGAGSGKTRALVYRVARLVAGGVAADRIFCVTFSRAGADEMGARIRKLGCHGVEVKTWHAFCARVLREEGTVEGSWPVDEKDKAKTLVKQAIGYKHLNWVGADLTKIRRFIGVCKANLWEADSEEAMGHAQKTFGHQAARAVKAFAISQELVEQAGLLTFDDMLVFTARLFANDDSVRQGWAAKFDYVLQDEAQDANRAQVTIARMLSKEHRNYMIVGDPGQAIYGFRGSTPAFLSEFPGEWDAKVVTMAKNYRSGAAIVGVANAVIREGKHRLPEDMSAERGFDGDVRVVSASTLDDEARELTAHIKSRIESGARPSDFCVLFRLNAQSRAVEEALLREKMPYVIIGGANFYERKEVKDLLGYLRVASARDADGEACRRCINAPFRFLGSAFVEKVADERRADAQASWESCVVRACNRDRIQQRQRESAFEWVRLVESVGRKIRGEERRPTSVDGDGAGSEPLPWKPFDVLNDLVTRTRYVEWLEKEEGEESIESSHGANVRELLRVSQAFDDVPGFLDFVDRQVFESARNRKVKGGNCVTLMTIHKSKGLEWPTVWVVGCNDTILPHAKGDPEEERRMAYVAFTRARDVLVVSHVREMAMRTGVRAVDRSPYLDAFPGVLEEEGGEQIVQDRIDQAHDERVVDALARTISVHGKTLEKLVGLLDDQRVPGPAPEHTAKYASERAPSMGWLGEGARCLDCGREVEECECGGAAAGASN